jgi:isopentenyldiphosphate isomerase
MYKTDNFEILIPSDEQVITYGQNDLLLEEGPAIARTNRDVDLFLRIEKVWSEKSKETLQKGKSLFAGPQYRLCAYHVLPDERIVLELGPTDYREFIGTNVEAGKDPGYMRTLVKRGLARYRDEDAFFSNTFAICSVVKTSDAKIVAGLRSDVVAEYPRCWHTVGGHPNPTRYQLTSVDLFEAMEREVTAELGMDQSEIQDMRMMGLMRNSRTRKPELMFHTTVYPVFDDLKERRTTGEKDEHFTLVGIRSLDELVDFLNSNQRQFAFPANSGLSLDEQDTLRPAGHPENTTNFFVPPGEASWVLYLKQEGVNVEKELPHLELVKK